MTIRTSWPSAVRAFGRLPATSPRPPTLASGYASADANRIFIGISGWTCGLDLNLRPERRSPRSIPREIVRSIRPERSRRIFPSTAMQRPMPPTPLGHLLFVFHTHLPWVLGHGRWPHGEAWLHEATAECYLPLLRLLDRLEKEGRKGSIATGIASYRRHFGRGPRGIWLPECAYRPGDEWSRPVGPAMTWLRPGLEDVVGRHGLRYFFVDTHLVAGGAPIGTYEDRLGQRRLDAARDGTGLSPNEPYTVSAAGRRK